MARGYPRQLHDTHDVISMVEQKRQSTGNSTRFKLHQPPSPLLSIVPPSPPPLWSPLYFYLTMPSPFPPYQLSSSQSSSSTSSRALQHRKSSTEKPGFVHRTSSSSSLHRATSNKSNSSLGLPSKLAPKHHQHHAHVAHTSASKHHRTTSFGHRIPSYGKGLNKLTALTT